MMIWLLNPPCLIACLWSLPPRHGGNDSLPPYAAWSQAAQAAGTAPRSREPQICISPQESLHEVLFQQRGLLGQKPTNTRAVIFPDFPGKVDFPRLCNTDDQFNAITVAGDSPTTSIDFLASILPRRPFRRCLAPLRIPWLRSTDTKPTSLTDGNCIPITLCPPFSTTVVHCSSYAGKETCLARPTMPSSPA